MIVALGPLPTCAVRELTKSSAVSAPAFMGRSV